MNVESSTVQADVGVGIRNLGTGKVLSSSGVSRPDAPVNSCWPSGKGAERPAIWRNIFDCCE